MKTDTILILILSFALMFYGMYYQNELRICEESQPHSLCSLQLCDEFACHEIVLSNTTRQGKPECASLLDFCLRQSDSFWLTLEGQECLENNITCQLNHINCTWSQNTCWCTYAWGIQADDQMATGIAGIVHRIWTSVIIKKWFHFYKHYITLTKSLYIL